jgi:hypothetical protein
MRDVLFETGHWKQTPTEYLHPLKIVPAQSRAPITDCAGAATGTVFALDKPAPSNGTTNFEGAQ